MKENSIEEDIKKVENYLENSAINDTNSNFFKNGGWETVDLEIPKAMQHILADYKRALKENEELLEVKVSTSAHNRILELEKEKEELKERIREHTLLISPYYIKENYIPIQKIKDKIETLEKIQKEFPDNERLEVKIIAYKELLEEGEYNNGE